ncbi:Neuraminidase [Penicillium canescens]|uniref:Neuraminidase n=1 Tax=Penicillium canescens TaxID=5083 RepID=UPI0026DFE026|nr:Neuraminidase [Penicillium canescens]KAJ6077091.1 Neuraminidase [Penicillium canescens]
MALIDFAENIIFQPDSDHSVLYPRQVELSDGSLLATASADGGATWSWVSNMPDQVNGLGMAAQPALAEMPFPVGNFPAGTVLASGNSWGTKARMSIYTLVKTKITHGNSSAMWRKAVDWILQVGIHGFGSHSFFCVFYSDQRDTLHGQKLAHQESTDLKSWSSVIDDVAYLNYTARPGMTVISYIPPLEKWILVHEFPGETAGLGQAIRSTIDCLVTHSIFALSMPSSSPYVVWSPVGGVNGTIVVSDADHGSIFTNRANGQPDQWEIHATPQPPAYSRSLHVFAKHPDHLMILGAAEFGQVENLPLHLSIVSLTDTLRRPAGN